MHTKIRATRVRELVGRSLASGTVGMVAVVLVVGAGTGLGAVGFRWLIAHATWIFTGIGDYSGVGVGQHPAHPALPWLGPWFILLVPVIGGLIYGPLVQRFAREARGHGVPEVMLAVAQNGGVIRPRVAVVKALASAVCIGAGGSVGREGPIVQIGAALGSGFGQLVRLPRDRMRLVAAAGAAAGIAATFNAPIAGVLFAVELILAELTGLAFILLVLASVVASSIGRALLGSAPFMQLPSFGVGHAWELGLYALLGLIAGAVGTGFAKFLYAVEDFFDRIWHYPEWARPVAGGVLLGVLLLVLPQLYGVGYPVLEAAVHGQYLIGFLLLLLVGKIVATSLTLGIGGSGGVFAPSLFIGGMLGAAFGDIAHLLLPNAPISVGAFAVVGMGAVFAGGARAPLTAIVMLVELTGEYSVVLPLMLAIVLATGVGRVLSRDSIYTLKLRRRGVVLDNGPAGRVLADRTVGSAMRPAPARLGPDDPLRQALATMARLHAPAVPVVQHGRVLGQVRASHAASLLAAMPDATVDAACEPVPTVRSEASLREALAELDAHPRAGALAVLDAGELVGWLTHREVLAALAPVEDPVGPIVRTPEPVAVR